MTNKRQRYFFVACILLIGLFIWHASTVNYIVDDSFISFRYARNLLRGDGLVYNPGERVEGYTNFLWVVLLAGVQWLLPQAQMLQIAQMLGITAGALTILLAATFSWKVHRKATLGGLLAAMFLTAHSGFVAWSTSGLETVLFTFLAFSGACAYVAYMRTGRAYWVWPLLFALATLARPDGILFFGATLLFAAFSAYWAERKLPLGRMVIWILLFAAIFGPYYIWRFNYYGYPLPNTFYVKVGSGFQQYVRGARYLWQYVKLYGFFVFVPPLLLLFKRPRPPWHLYFAVLIAAYLAYIVYVGGDGLAFYRFIVHIAPILYLLVQEGFIELYAQIKRVRWQQERWRPALPVALLTLASLVMTTRQSAASLVFPDRYRWYEPQSELSFPGDGKLHSYAWFDNYFVDRLATAAKWLDQDASPDALVASTPAGAVAYYMDLDVIDMLGLNDAHIAHVETSGLGKDRAGHEKGDGRYVLSRSPDYILMGNVAVLSQPLNEDAMAEKLIRTSEHELWAEPMFHERYELRCVRLNNTGVFQYFTFYQKKDLQRAGEAYEDCGSADQ